MGDGMKTYEWIEELLADLQAFSEFNNLILLRDSVNHAREVFRVEAASMVPKTNVTRLNVGQRSHRSSVQPQPQVSGEVVHLFGPIAGNS
jgi:hypothetical protein